MSTDSMVASLLLQAGGATPGILGSPLIMMVIVMGIFYVMLILPQQRQRKKTQAMLAALKNGDKVVTSSGIYGTVNGIDGDTVILKIADQVKIRILRSAIAQIEAEENAGYDRLGAARKKSSFAADCQPPTSIMNPKLKWKALFILVGIPLCLYGLIGLPTCPT